MEGANTTTPYLSIVIGIIVIVFSIIVKRWSIREDEDDDGDVSNNFGKPNSMEVNHSLKTKKKKPIFVLPHSVSIGENGKVVFWQQLNENNDQNNEYEKINKVSVCSLILKSCLSGTFTTETTRCGINNDKRIQSYAIIEGSVIYSDFESGRIMRVMAHMSEPLPLTPLNNQVKYSHFTISYANSRLSHFSRSIMDAELYCIREESLQDNNANDKNDNVGKANVSSSNKSIVCINISSASNEPMVITNDKFNYGNVSVSYDGKWCCYTCWNLDTDVVELHIQPLINNQTNSSKTYRISSKQQNNSMSEPRWSHNGDLYFLSSIKTDEVGGLNNKDNDDDDFKHMIHRLPSQVLADIYNSLNNHDGDDNHEEMKHDDIEDMLKLSHKSIMDWNDDNKLNVNNKSLNKYYCVGNPKTSNSNYCILKNNTLIILLSSSSSSSSSKRLVSVKYLENKYEVISSSEQVNNVPFPLSIDSVCCDTDHHVSSMDVNSSFYITGRDDVNSNGKESQLFEVVYDDATSAYSKCNPVLL